MNIYDPDEVDVNEMLSLSEAEKLQEIAEFWGDVGEYNENEGLSWKDILSDEEALFMEDPALERTEDD